MTISHENITSATDGECATARNTTSATDGGGATDENTTSATDGGGATDEHPQSPWVSIKDRLPEPHETVLVYGLFADASSTAIVDSPTVELNQRFSNVEQKRMRRLARRVFDKYGFPNYGNPKYEVLAWMPIPAIPEEYIDKKKGCMK